MFSNPLADPLFIPSAQYFASILGLGLLILLVVKRRSLQTFHRDVLFQRWRTWAIIAPIYLLGIFSGTLAIVVLVLGLTLQGLREYQELVRLPVTYRRVLLLMGLIAAPLAALSSTALYTLGPLLLMVATLQPILFSHDAQGVRQLAFAALGWGYIAWFLAHIVLIHQHIDGGPGILVALGVTVAASDVSAFVFGKLFGRHPLSPRLSPNKTIEGVIGNLVGAYAALQIMRFTLPDPVTTTWMLILLGMLIGGACVWGDLLESAIKREFEKKDAGSWLPGFGGILDRIDSLIIAAPLVYFLLFSIQ